MEAIKESIKMETESSYPGVQGKPSIREPYE